MDGYDNRLTGSTIVLAGTKDVLTGEHAVHLAQRTGKNPLAAYFETEFTLRLQERAAPGDRHKTSVVITPLRTGGFRAKIEHVPSPGASARTASKDFPTMKDLVRTLNHALLRGAGDQKLGLLAHLSEARDVDYETGIEVVKGILHDPKAMTNARTTLRSRFENAIAEKSPGADYSLMIWVTTLEESDEQPLAGVVAQVDFYRLPADCATMIGAMLVPIAQEVRKGENSQKYTITAPSAQALLHMIDRQLQMAAGRLKDGWAKR